MTLELTSVLLMTALVVNTSGILFIVETLPDAERFDLMVGTNIFLYYDRLQQALATVSVANMLKPGGLLLSNNALVEVPVAGLRSIGYSKILYSNREEDGDLIIWYQKPR